MTEDILRSQTHNDQRRVVSPIFWHFQERKPILGLSELKGRNDDGQVLVNFSSRQLCDLVAGVGGV